MPNSIWRKIELCRMMRATWAQHRRMQTLFARQANLEHAQASSPRRHSYKSVLRLLAYLYSLHLLFIFDQFLRYIQLKYYTSNWTQIELKCDWTDLTFFLGVFFLTDDKPEMLIGRYYLQRSNALVVGKHWTQGSDHQNQTAIQFSYRVLCQADYYGKLCSTKCTPRNDNIGHYECGQDGKPICHEGYSGSYCDKRKYLVC